MPASDDDLASLQRMVDAAVLWGLELDIRYRVLGATFELTATRHPVADVSDRRVQVLLSPINRVAAVLRRQLEDGREAIEQFDVDQLVTVVEAGFAGATPTVTIDGDDEPLTGRFPELSLHGESQALDGRSHSLSLSTTSSDGRRHLDLQVTFDEVELRDADGATLP